VSLTSDSETVEEVVFLEEAYAAVLGGTFAAAEIAPAHGDSVLSVTHGDTVTATYLDADDGTGSEATSIATTIIDCAGPVIDDVQVTAITQTSALITWSTDEPSSSSVTLQGPSGSASFSDAALVTAHAVPVDGLAVCAPHQFSVGSQDLAGNAALDDNSGDLYDFVSGCPIAPPGPDGSGATDPVKVSKGIGSTLVVSWDNSCVAPGPTKVLYGPLASVAQYTITGALCGIPPGDALVSWASVPSGNLWFVVVKEDAMLVEGSWGNGSAGERNGAVASGQCGAFDKDPSGSCP
jgi:hypothetical protein